jgi:hypothetical protein
MRAETSPRPQDHKVEILKEALEVAYRALVFDLGAYPISIVSFVAHHDGAAVKLN